MVAHKTPAFVKVTWHDAEDLAQSWVSSDQIAAAVAQPCLVISWGYLVSKNRKDIVLAADLISRDETYGRVTKIPRGMVQVITVIEKPVAR